MKVHRAAELCSLIIENVKKIYVGEEITLKKILACALANGHILFEDYPGLGKTLLVKTFSKLIGCKFRRIQFTPDLLPADIIGTKVWKYRTGEFVLMKGPIFTNILLADEINRAPPKTQSALLEAMEERQVSIEGETYRLEAPFIVLATQNPIELEGTYPLPEAQMDRFMMRLSIGYVKRFEDESEILKRRIKWKKDDPTIDLKPIIDNRTFVKLQRVVEEDVYIDDSIIDYISQIVWKTREHPKVEVGSSPRGGLALLKLSRAMALIEGRDFVVPDDVKAFAREALSHRIILKMEFVLEGETQERVIDEILRNVKPPIEVG
ncbi:MoxR family ATPase [Candidatus Bathyarchaeota archaeon]|nr:MoxR family ATPase [Candidatus Bathyarchaeota archaeon]